jgi:hypothetical protein
MALHSVGQSPSRLGKKRGRYHRVSRVREKLRIASNIGLIVGQCILLFVDREWGLRFIIASSMLSLPYFWHARMWDVLALMAFLNVVNVVGLFVK